MRHNAWWDEKTETPQRQTTNYDDAWYSYTVESRFLFFLSVPRHNILNDNLPENLASWIFKELAGGLGWDTPSYRTYLPCFGNELTLYTSMEGYS